MNWNGQRVLVTGAGGFLAMMPPALRERVSIIGGDLRDGAAVTRAMDGCSTVFHLGALISIPYSYLHPLQGQSPYSASKIGADKIVESFQRSFYVPAVTVRPFNTYGGRQSMRAVIPTIITQALNNDGVRPGKSEVLRLRSNNDLARELMGWRPTVSLDKGLRRTVEWIREHIATFGDTARYTV